VTAIYVGSLLFGGLLIVASVLGIGHGSDAHGGDAGGGGASDGDHGHGSSNALLSLLGLRFWSFATAFFGLTGLIVGGLGWSGVAPIAAAGVGVAAGFGASTAFRVLSRDVIGQVSDASALVGREGRLLLPVNKGQRGKIRLTQAAGGHVDLLAESDDDDALPAGADVLIVEVRGNVAIVARGSSRN
jgi:membrane protein implicated in regulation of membrane protease activity